MRISVVGAARVAALGAHNGCSYVCGGPVVGPALTPVLGRSRESALPHAPSPGFRGPEARCALGFRASLS